jgi:hypothetical protein
LAFALGALFAAASGARGALRKRILYPGLELPEDYLAQRQNNPYAYSYAPYALYRSGVGSAPNAATNEYAVA